MPRKLITLILMRIAVGLLLLLVVSAVIFLGVEALPGDTAEAILGRSATPDALANLRAKLGLDQPAWERYFTWLTGVLSGDLGKSLTNGADIAAAIAPRLHNSLFLAASAAVIAVPLALGLGVIAARYAGRWPDKIISAVTLSTISLPEFVAAYFVIYALTQLFPVFQPVSMVFAGMSLPDKLRAIALPVIVLVIVVLAHMMRMTRAAILSVMQSAYIETAELKGLPPVSIILRHALPNAISPIVSVISINLAYLVVGVVVVEVVFGYNAMGQFLVDHVAKRDLPVVQASALIFAVVYIGLNIFADVVSIVANPRLRHPK
ncbi:MAG: ABC transporter permease [Rhodobacteraceae bacterium]|jgi:peptide/nickel transport system permease protein|nr:ABC transporter permease [Paracoccaceae bacterium]